MTVSALVSGGKDSVYAAYLAETQGWPVDELVVLRPPVDDSLLFHTPNLDLVALQARAWGKRHRAVPVAGGTEADELRALRAALDGARGPVVCGAIESSYQWARLTRVASELGRRLYAPLWRRPALRVVAEELAAGLDIRFVHLAAEGLPDRLLGARLDAEALAWLRSRADGPRSIHPAGEGGEYETVVVDAPFFSSSIEFDTTERRTGGSTARLDIRAAHLKSHTPLAGPRSP